MPEVVERRAPPEPVAVVDRVDDQPRLEHERVRDHRVVIGIGVLPDVELFLDDSARIREERPLRTDRVAELLGRVVLVGGDCGDFGVGDVDLRIVRGELEVLLVLLWAVVAAREREDHRILALDLAEPARDALVVGQLVVGESVAWDDVGAHRALLSLVGVDTRQRRASTRDGAGHPRLDAGATQALLVRRPSTRSARLKLRAHTRADWQASYLGCPPTTSCLRSGSGRLYLSARDRRGTCRAGCAR